MVENYYDSKFELGHFEMNELGVASPVTMLTLLEETAADHCLFADYGLYELERQKIGWVLISGFLQMDRYPRYKEKIVIRTWLSNYTSIKGFRENIIYDESNNILGRGKSIWVFFDIEKRKPIRIFEDIKTKWSSCSVESIDKDISQKIEGLEDFDWAKQFKVNRYDTDIYGHLNNIRYLQWVVESIPEEIYNNYYLYSIDGRFTSEAHRGQTVVSLTKNDSVVNINDDKIFSHTIKISTEDKVCATAKTVWKKIKV